MASKPTSDRLTAHLENRLTLQAWESLTLLDRRLFDCNGCLDGIAVLRTEDQDEDEVRLCAKCVQDRFGWSPNKLRQLSKHFDDHLAQRLALAALGVAFWTERNRGDYIETVNNLRRESNLEELSDEELFGRLPND